MGAWLPGVNSFLYNPGRLDGSLRDMEPKPYTNEVFAMVLK